MGRGLETPREGKQNAVAIRAGLGSLVILACHDKYAYFTYILKENYGVHKGLLEEDKKYL